MSIVWERLAARQCCLDEAWAAYCAGCKPIGAAITDCDGRIVARGRNRIGEYGAMAGQISGHQLAHAELNALLALDFSQVDPYTSALYTTTEPCPLCFGAFYMSGLRTLHFAARDPWAGSANLLGTTPYLHVKPTRISGPRDAALETILIAMHVETDLAAGRPRASQLLTAWDAVVPEGVALGDALFQSGELRRLREQSATMAEVLSYLAAHPVLAS